MKLYRMTGVIVVSIALRLILGAVIVSAQTPLGSGPSGVPYADNQIHTLPGNSSVLYRFDYSLDTLNGIRPVTTILLVDGYNSGVNFEVWTPDAVNDMGNNHPIGRGSSVTIDCDTRLPLSSGQCISPDLQWSGAFGGSGTYYVRVVNSNNTQSNFQKQSRPDETGTGRPVPRPPYPL